MFYKSKPIINLNEFLPELITEDAVNKIFALPEDVTSSLEVFKYPKLLEKEVCLYTFLLLRNLRSIAHHHFNWVKVQLAQQGFSCRSSIITRPCQQN
jgi:hypothetical protein